MARSEIDFETVKSLAAELGDARLGADGVSIRAHGKLLAWIPPHKSMEPGTLAVRIDQQRRAELIEAAPEIYFLTDHYLKYPTVLVRLSAIPKDALRDLLHMAWSAAVAELPKRSVRKGTTVKKTRRLT